MLARAAIDPTPASATAVEAEAPTRELGALASEHVRKRRLALVALPLHIKAVGLGPSRARCPGDGGRLLLPRGAALTRALGGAAGGAQLQHSRVDPR